MDFRWGFEGKGRSSSFINMSIILVPITWGVCCCTDLKRQVEKKKREWGGLGGGGGDYCSSV